jgi:hypothetical protein
MNELKYSISFSKDHDSEEYCSRIVQVGSPGGIIVRTPYKEPGAILHHLEEIKDMLELKIIGYYNKLKRYEDKA